MKRLALVAAVLALAACTAKKDEAAVDTSAPAMAPAPPDGHQHEHAGRDQHPDVDQEIALRRRMKGRH